MTEQTDAELEAIFARRLGGAVNDTRGVAAARERVWAAIQARAMRAHRPSAFGWMTAATLGIAAVVALIVGLAWTQQYRFEVAQGGVPVLYREEVGRTTLRGEGVDADIVVQLRHVEGATGLRAGMLIDVRVGPAVLPATIEARARLTSSTIIEVIGRTAGIAETRDPTQVSRTTFFASLPRTAGGATRTYEVWLSVETARGIVESDKLLVEVTGRPEGERARVVEP